MGRLVPKERGSQGSVEQQHSPPPHQIVELLEVQNDADHYYRGQGTKQHRTDERSADERDDNDPGQQHSLILIRFITSESTYESWNPCAWTQDRCDGVRLCAQ